MHFFNDAFAWLLGGMKLAFYGKEEVWNVLFDPFEIFFFCIFIKLKKKPKYIFGVLLTYFFKISTFLEDWEIFNVLQKCIKLILWPVIQEQSFLVSTLFPLQNAFLTLQLVERKQAAPICARCAWNARAAREARAEGPHTLQTVSVRKWDCFEW